MGPAAISQVADFDIYILIYERALHAYFLLLAELDRPLVLALVWVVLVLQLLSCDLAIEQLLLPLVKLMTELNVLLDFIFEITL